MDTIIAAVIFTTFVAVVVGLLQHTWRATAHQPHAPWGSDAARDEDLHRVLHDLHAH